MKLSIEMIKDLLLYEFKSESELKKTISELSENFTKSRDKVGDYLNSEKMVSAYTCFYLMTNIPKLEAAMDLLSLDETYLNSFDLFDIGSGPGTFSLAMLGMNKDLKIYCIEKSEPMIKQGMKLFDNLYPGHNVNYVSLGQIPKKTRKRIGLFGHSANEMGADFSLKLINDLELDEVIFIEPGTKQFFSEFLKIRQGLIDNYNIEYPCKSISSCPLSAGDWCHQYLKLSHEDSVERLTQLVSKDRRNSPVSLSYFKKDSVSQTQNRARIIRVYTPTKFSLEWQVCILRDSINVIVDMQILLRPYKKKEVKELQKILAGREFEYTIDKELSDGKFRVKLDKLN